MLVEWSTLYHAQCRMNPENSFVVVGSNRECLLVSMGANLERVLVGKDTTILQGARSSSGISLVPRPIGESLRSFVAVFRASWRISNKGKTFLLARMHKVKAASVSQ
jgi:hypothetical protein